ncbi:mucin-5AC isoform X1 [Culex quinquefasciatus]|uniref:mucin-5AC isoform X1 n=1 Tax=Culex quinquefasciatus TaxID=7176 RepID=UPI0018E39A21|nr:mucin-5AC isoform X1 [Culex quinquefasciatus]
MRQRFRALLGMPGQQLMALALVALMAVGEVRAQEATTSLKPQVLNDGSFKFAAKTSFSCSGRAAGYYADVETGCQIYHMCDGLGRQFSYACPNTTLFQQRMLICDHWYMVNCSKAEGNYAANLLIGQRDKPFVPEDENEVRTPRPDLLDSPYSASFAGEPIMYNFIKTNTPAPQNTISNGRGGGSSSFTSSRKNHPHAKAPPTASKGSPPKTTPTQATLPPPPPQAPQAPEIFEESASNHGLPIHWSTRYAKEDEDEGQKTVSPASTSIPLNAEEEELQSNKINGRREVVVGGTEQGETRDESRNTPVRFENRTVKVPSIRYEPPYTPEEISKKEVAAGGSKESLGAGFKPFESILNFNKKGNRKDYDFSNFFTRNESIRNTVPTTTSTVATSTTARAVTTTTTTSRPTSWITTTTRQQFVSSGEVKQPVLFDLQPPKANPAQFAPRTGSAFRPWLTTSTTAAPRIVTTTTTTTVKPRTLSDPRESNRPPTAILFNAPAATSGLFENRFAIQRPPVAAQANVPVPSTEILPPFPNVANYDKIKTRYVSQPVFTRQPITNEPSAGPITSGIDKLQEVPLIQVRKDTIPRPFSVPAPANDLLPPKKDYTYYDDSTTKGPPIYYQWKWSIPSFGLEPPLDAPLTDEEKLLTQLNPAESADSTREHNQTARSISSETGNLGENNPEPSTINKRKIAAAVPTHNYLELRRKLAIPDFTFPLEAEPSDRRTVFEHDGAVNSFQIKIPAYARSDDDSTAWYGENAKCPECHPAFLRPNSCEPCVKIRR